MNLKATVEPRFVRENERAAFECKVKGNEAVTYQWIIERNGKELYRIEKDKKYVIHNVKRTHNGLQFKCKVTSKYTGRIGYSNTATLTVKCRYL